jgi:glycosyltransferase involved in cell wall biosynthesis
MASWHVITCEFPPLLGGVSAHTRVLAQQAAARGHDVHVWAPARAHAMRGMHVHDTLGRFSADDLDATADALRRQSGPKRFVLQWVPHGYGRRGLNVRFTRWMADRLQPGDELDVIVHEPFVDYFGSSVIQPLRAAVQRHMARTVLRRATRVWLSIPGWESRLRNAGMPLPTPPRVLPIPGTIPVDDNAGAVANVRERLRALGHERIVGVFATGGPFAERVLVDTARELFRHDPRPALLCLGKGGGELTTRLQRQLQGGLQILPGGEVSDAELSHRLQVCDLLLQPYPDGVSGRRTTTISALEHGLPVATTFGELSEPFWRETGAVETRPVDPVPSLAAVVSSLMDPVRNADARRAAIALYRERFAPAVALAPLFES